ncbi:helix-hairpin-helix domain-containing protein [Opitutus terrae]|uniref:DNA polymerase beta n=1 Tax=Opitutus terrae (strain DSM 11246 / JCM 15787 / PB90-1) TaxID=452637 RepID=B1ZX38_OPITP|nr:helix-hairpin-helix domain-containing protein [Opitutus terrae]ACB76090.1 PHP domain protein [Opitutus terrae PB90-1]
MTKHEIADVLNEIALLLELKGENPFKIRAYQSGARVIESLEQPELERLLAANELLTVKGIGEALAKKIAELHTTGKLEFLEKLRATIAPGLVELLQIPGVGPKKIKVLHEQLGVVDIASLAAACADGRVAALAGFGAKTQEKIVAGIKNREAYGRRHLWWEAWQVAQPIVAGLRALPQVKRAEAAGSLRRGLETVGDLDFIVSATEIEPVVSWFVGLSDVQEVTARGETKTSVRFVTGLQADLRLVPDEQFIFALHHFTGSKDHNVQMRQRALARGLTLSEWGLEPVTAATSESSASPSSSLTAAAGAGEAAAPRARRPKRAGAPADAASGDPARGSVATEADLFARLGLHFIPPELREGMGEIEAAEHGELPTLVDLPDLRGTFHCHTTASDGRNTLAEMATAAASAGWEYLGIADHSKSSFQANGLTEQRLLEQVEAIRVFNASGRCRTHVFAGTECDILPDGRLDFDEALLRKLDYVVASVHSTFALDEAAMTARIIRAIEHPCTTMLGHLTGRLLLRRDGYRVDAGKIIDAAIAHGVIIEINAAPKRLDMDWRHWRKATARGLLTSINPDAHETAELAYVRAGINTARKGWLTKAQVFNTRSLAEVKAAFLARRRAG